MKTIMLILGAFFFALSIHQPRVQKSSYASLASRDAPLSGDKSSKNAVAAADEYPVQYSKSRVLIAIKHRIQQSEIGNYN
jgi:hypothetical protein